MVTRQYEKDGDWIVRETYTPTEGVNDPSTVPQWKPYRHLRVSLEDGSLINDGTDTEQISIEVVSGLDVVRGEEPSAVKEDHTATLVVDEAEVSVEITAGIGTKEITTTKNAGGIIEVQATELEGVLAESSDTKEIEVLSA